MALLQNLKVLPQALNSTSLCHCHFKNQWISWTLLPNWQSSVHKSQALFKTVAFRLLGKWGRVVHQNEKYVVSEIH